MGRSGFIRVWKDAMAFLIENPQKEADEKELTRVAEKIFRRMGQNVGLLSAKVASLLRWVLDLLERGC